jgi:tetratricopeptide (TPR) repeat protein
MPCLATWKRAALVAVCLFAGLTFGESSAARAEEPERLAPADYYHATALADELAQSGDFARAAALYEKLVATSPDDARVWRQLGSCRLGEKRYREAARAFERALGLAREPDPNDRYDAARAYALAGDRQSALDALDALDGALAAGFERRADVAGDPAFASLRDNPRFAKAAGQAPRGPLDRAAAWRSDLDFLVAEIRRLHAAYRTQPLPEGFERAAATLRERLPALSDEEIIVGLQGLMARLGDGHSTIYFFFGPHSLRQIPIRFYDFCDGLYVTSAPAGLERLIGARVAAIGSLAPEEALARVAPYVSKDNPMFVRAMGANLLAFPGFLHAIGAVADPRHIPLTVLGPGGSRETVDLEPRPAGSIAKTLTPSALPGAPPAPLYLRRAEEAFWLEALPEPKTLFVQFNQVRDTPGETLAAFALRLRRAVDEQGTKNLIVDVRLNTGGNAHLLNPLLRTLIHFETTRPDARLFVLTSRSTYSAAQIFINKAGRLTNAIFAGEPSSSSPNFIGEDTPVVLPASGLVASVSSRYHQSDPLDVRFWIAPDIPVPLCAKDYFANRDPTLETVRAILSARKSSS